LVDWFPEPIMVRAGAGSQAMRVPLVSSLGYGTSGKEPFQSLQVVDEMASALTATYVSGAVLLPPQPSLDVTGAGENLQFNWSVASGSFQVQTADNPLGPWTTIVLPMITNGDKVSVIVSPTNHNKFFRLHGQ
jgi:hypothetical protein